MASFPRASAISATAISLGLLGCTSRAPLVVNQDAAGAGGTGPGLPAQDAAPTGAAGDVGRGGGGGGGGDVAGGAGGSSGGGTGGSSGGGTGGSSGGGGAAAGTGGARACTVTTASGTTVACTERLLGSHQQDLYCGLKAGEVRCWADQAFYQSTLGPAVAQTPPGLVQLSIAENAGSDPFFCGVDARGSGTCWGPRTTRSLGENVASTAISRYGPCAVFNDGHVKCTNTNTLPPGHRYVQVAISADYIIALDDTGTPVHTATDQKFPPGVYLKVGITTGAIGAALRDDGALVYLMRPEPKVVPGSFVDFALDYHGHMCGIDGAGEITCFTFADDRPPVPSPPPGPFIQIAGGVSTFCGLRPTGTTTCWGDVPVPVPDGW